MQGVHALHPKGSVVAEPFVHLCKGLPPQAVHPELRLLAHFDEAGLTQDSQVSRDPRTSDRQLRGQLTRGRRPAAQGLEYGPAARVRQGLKYSVHSSCVT